MHDILTERTGVLAAVLVGVEASQHILAKVVKVENHTALHYLAIAC